MRGCEVELVRDAFDVGEGLSLRLRVGGKDWEDTVF